MFQYPQTKICPWGQSVSIPPCRILLIKKRKILCGNQKPYVNKTLHSGTMKHSQLKNKTMESKSKN